MPDLYLSEKGEPEWWAMLGRPHGEEPKREDILEEARLLFNRFVSDGLVQCGNCGEVVEPNFTKADELTGGKHVMCKNGHLTWAHQKYFQTTTF